MRRQTLFIPFLIALLAPVDAQLQAVQPGVRIRVKAPGVLRGRVDATVLSRSGDTVVITDRWLEQNIALA